MAKQTSSDSRPVGRVVTDNVIELELQRLQIMLRHIRFLEFREKAAIGYLKEKRINVGSNEYKAWANRVDLKKWYIAVLNSIGAPYRRAGLSIAETPNLKPDVAHTRDAGTIGAVQIVEISKELRKLFVTLVDRGQSLHLADALQIGSVITAIEIAYLTLNLSEVPREAISRHQAGARKKLGEKTSDAISGYVREILGSSDRHEFIWWTPKRLGKIKFTKLAKAIATRMPGISWKTVKTHLSELYQSGD